MRHRPTLRSTMLAAVLTLFLAAQAFASPRFGPPGWQPPGQYARLANQPKYVVLLVLDGGLPSYLNLASFPHIAALIQNGVTYSSAFDGMLETETPTGHATLGTGSLPRHHGVISFSWYTDQGVKERPTNPIPIQQGQLEQVLRRSGAPSIASLLKQHDPTATVAVTSGHKDYAVDSVGGWAADYLMYYTEHGQTWTPVGIPRHMPPQTVLQAPGLTAYAPHLAPGDQDELAIKLALSSFQQVHQRLTIINQPEFDWPLGHLLGASEDTWFAWKLMARLDYDIGLIETEFAQAGVLRKTLFVLTADHGMVSLKHGIPHAELQQAVAAAGTTLADYDYHTGGYLWLMDRKKAAEVASKILALKNPNIRAVYYRPPGVYTYVRASAVQSLASPAVDRAYQFLLSTLAGPSAPEVVLFLRENTSIVGRNEVGWRGDHGGASWNAEHIPLIFSGPGVRHDATSDYPATLYDVAPTILTLLGIAPRGMDGVPLVDGMSNPDLSLVAGQQLRGQMLLPIVQALMLQSARDGT